MDTRQYKKQHQKDRQEALREYLSKRGQLSYIFDNIEKMEKEGSQMDSGELNALKSATDVRVKMLNKYLPDLKSTEITSESNDGAFIINVKSYKQDD